MLESGFLAACFHHVPDNILRDSFAPHLAVPGDGPKDSSLGDAGCFGPFVQGDLHPPGNGDGADMAALADQVHNRPVTLPHLQVIHAQSDQFRTPETAPE